MAALRGNPVAWQSFYTTARWRRLRKFQLMQHPLCKFCLQRGIRNAGERGLVLVVGGFYPLLYKHHRGECRFNGGMLGEMVRILKTPSGMTRVRPSIERVQMLQSSSGVIQLALTPVFLLTAVAALLNVFSTRLGRVADRVDLLSGDLKRGAADTEFLSAQLDFLRRRSLILDVAVVLATVGGAATCAAALVLFLSALRNADVSVQALRAILFGLFGGAIVFTLAAK